MGLDTTHNCWHGAYSGYMRWRMKMMDLTGKFINAYDRWEYKGTEEEWKTEPYAGLGYLMSHSDCDGEIPVEMQLELAECLELLVRSYPDADWGGHIGTWHATTLQFAAGLREAHALGEPVEYH